MADEKSTVKSVAEKPKLGKLKPGYTRVKLLRNHDGRDGFYERGKTYDVWGPYVDSQINGKTADGHSYKVEPLVFEVIERA